MSIRVAMHRRITEDEAIAAIIPPQRWMEGGSLLETPVRPFAVMRYQGHNPGLSRVNQTRLEVWVHDEPGNYIRIEQVLRLVRERITSMVAYNDVELGVSLMDPIWEGESVDLFDDGHRTNTKSSTFLLTGTGF